MFEKEIKFIIDFTLNRVNKLGSFFPYERLATAEIHPAIQLYISAHLDYLIYEDRKKLLQNSSFDYSGSEISNYFNLISEEIKKNKRLAFEDIKTLVTHAVTFNVNYLVRPNWTLSKLIFDENKTRNVNEIRMILNYLYYYDYIKNVFNGYFSKRKILSLDESEFGMILGKIDRQMFNEHTRDLVDNALVSIGDFFNEGGVNKTRIDTQTVELFLKEKDLMEPLFKLRRSIPADDKRKYDIDDIRRILYSKEKVKVQQEEKEENPGEDSAPVPDEDSQTDTKIALTEESQEREDSVSEVNEARAKVNREDGSEEEISFDENVSDERDMEGRIPQSSGDEILNDAEEGSGETSEEENEKKEILQESPDDFLTRYKSELKSLEDLEQQLDNLSSEDDLTFEELHEENEAEKIEHKSEPAAEETASGEQDEDEQIDKKSADEKYEKNEPEQLASQETVPEGEEESGSDELIIEEEELSFDDDETVEEQQPEPPAAPVRKNNDILSFLSDKDMEKIVSNVFNEDEEDFVNTMEKISESASYDEATEILKAVFFSYKVSPYSRDAVTLTNAVSNFFNQD